MYPKPRRIARGEKILRLKTIKFNQAKKGEGVSNPKRGYRRGYKPAFDFAEPSIHAGFKPSFKGFHTIRIKDLALKGAESFLLCGFDSLNCPHHCPHFAKS